MKFTKALGSNIVVSGIGTTVAPYNKGLKISHTKNILHPTLSPTLY